MKKIFVIMPFVEANDRKEADLKQFFTDYIKEPIEAAFVNKYEVNRSGDSFSILDKIITNLAEADIVICDLSGERANPNVIYELGVRLSISNKPVILIREEKDTNKSMFDIGGLYAHPYRMNATKDLEKFLIKKIGSYENNHETFDSPVLKTLNHQAAFWMLLPIRKASAFLGGIASAADAHLKAFSQAFNIFATKNDIPFALIDYMQTYKEIGKITEEHEVKMLSYEYKICSIPSLDSYLSSVYLLGLIDDGIEKKFREYAMTYSLNFNSGNSSLFSKNKQEEYLSYSYETLILMNASRILIKILNSNDNNQIKQFKLDFNELISNSRIAGD